MCFSMLNALIIIRKHSKGITRKDKEMKLIATAMKDGKIREEGERDGERGRENEGEEIQIGIDRKGWEDQRWKEVNGPKDLISWLSNNQIVFYPRDCVPLQSCERTRGYGRRAAPVRLAITSHPGIAKQSASLSPHWRINSDQGAKGA